MSAQLTIDGRDTRVKTYKQRNCCGPPCWCARCSTCGEPLTKHDYTEEDAVANAVDALNNAGSRWQHRCKA